MKQKFNFNRIMKICIIGFKQSFIICKEWKTNEKHKLFKTKIRNLLVNSDTAC